MTLTVKFRYTEDHVGGHIVKAGGSQYSALYVNECHMGHRIR